MADEVQDQVLQQLLESKNFTPETVKNEVSVAMQLLLCHPPLSLQLSPKVNFWFNMGLPRQYIKNTTPQQMARHVQSYLVGGPILLVDLSQC
jgi:hypothetical protein